MKVEVLSESGYEQAALGFSLSYNSTIERAKELLPKYAFGIPGENKFLESIYIWLDVTAPRYWWQEADTYRVGSSKQSESTMHTLSKRELGYEDFEHNFAYEILHEVNKTLEDVKYGFATLDELKNILPEGFLQRRIWCLNYKCLQNIYLQRRNHKLNAWRFFCTEVTKKIEHREFIVKSILTACVQKPPEENTTYSWKEVE